MDYIKKINNALKTPYSRKEIISLIKETATDEFETQEDVWKIAIKTDSELSAELLNIKEYLIRQQKEEDIEENCLFVNYDKQPEELKKICDKWFEIFTTEGNNYINCGKFQVEVEQIGYTFDFGLDAEPFSLRKKT